VQADHIAVYTLDNLADLVALRVAELSKGEANLSQERLHVPGQAINVGTDLTFLILIWHPSLQCAQDRHPRHLGVGN